MDSTVGVRTSQFEGFDIAVAAMLRGDLWFTEYQIKKDGEIISHWRAPQAEGRHTEDAACNLGVALATDDIRIGLKQIFV